MAKAQSLYPGAIDTTFQVDRKTGDIYMPDWLDRIEDALFQLETELGTDPAGASADLKTRLGNVTATEFAELETLGDTTISATQWGALGSLVEWTDWVPTLIDDADLSGYDTARYYRLGDICFFMFIANNKNVTTAGAVIKITLPFTAANIGETTLAGIIHDGAAWIGMPRLEIGGNTNHIYVYKNAAGGGWVGTEAGVYIRLNGFFEII